jgi:hypothetical protein
MYSTQTILWLSAAVRITLRTMHECHAPAPRVTRGQRPTFAPSLVSGISLLELNSLEIEMCKWLTFRLVLEPEDLRNLVSAMGDCASPYWASWLNVPHVPNVTPRPIACAGRGPMHASPSAADFRKYASAFKSRNDPVPMTIGDMAALLWPAVVLQPAAPAPISPEVQLSSAKEMRQQPDSPRYISWVDSTALTKQHEQRHVQAHTQQGYELDRQQKQHQMMQQPVHRWGLVSSMEVR